MPSQEDYFRGHDGLSLYERTWLPAGGARAAIVFVHGLIEYSGCHVETAEALVREGFSVHAMDLRGHGRSEGPRCDVRSFNQYLLDLDEFFARVLRTSAGQPIFLWGNSMGGLIASLWTIQRRPSIRGLVLSGPLLALADGLYPRLRHWAALAAAVAPRLRFARVPSRWLSTDQQVINRLRNDPLVFHGRFTVRMAAEIICATKDVAAQAAGLSTPLLILHGEQDRICSPAASRALCEKASSGDKTLHFYEGSHHVVMNGTLRDGALADFIDWIDKRVPAAPCGLPETGGSLK